MCWRLSKIFITTSIIILRDNLIDLFTEVHITPEFKIALATVKVIGLLRKIIIIIIKD